MKMMKTILASAAVLTLAACAYGPDGRFVEINPEDNTSDRHLGEPNHLSNMRDAGIWVDPHGCDHWIIDEGVEGFMSARLDPYGNPVCSGIAPPTVAVGRYRRGT
ncbi:MAG: hypothetical protein JJU15_13425 [Pararhodobacter sp.]|nr:hypothetical protein [Pararhodobacter sp.]